MRLVKLIKLKEAENPAHPDNIEVGHETVGQYFKEPIVGEPFYVGWGWRTSTVQEIIDSNTFRTHNSIYKYEIM